MLKTFVYYGKFAKNESVDKNKQDFAANCAALNCTPDSRWIEIFGEYHIYQSDLPNDKIRVKIDEQKNYPEIYWDGFGNVRNCDISRATSMGMCILKISESVQGTGGRYFLCQVPKGYPESLGARNESYNSSQHNDYSWCILGDKTFKRTTLDWRLKNSIIPASKYTFSVVTKLKIK